MEKLVKDAARPTGTLQWWRREGDLFPFVQFRLNEPGKRPVFQPYVELMNQMVAAPDMLAALESFVHRWTAFPNPPTGRDLEIYLNEARAAIAKAKGAEPAAVSEPAKTYLYTEATCPSKHWNPGDDICADCGAVLG